MPATLLARVALATACILGCSPTPPATLQPSERTAPAATSASSSPAVQSPHPSATSTPPVEPTPPLEHLAIHWERVPALEGHSIAGLAAGRAGWVAVGDCQPPDISLNGCPTAWTSTDGLTWSEGPMPHEWNDTGFSEVAASNDGFAAFGGDEERDVVMPRSEWGPRVWLSDDGRSWELIQTGLQNLLRRGESVENLAVTPSGTLLAVLLQSPGPQFQYTGPWVSKNGRDWRLLDPAKFGLETLNVETLGSTSSAAFIAGWPCGECLLDTHVDGASGSSGIWTSIDGVEWTTVAPMGSLPGPAGSFATDGVRSVALVRACGRDSCSSELWSSSAGGPWRLAHGPIDGTSPEPLQLVRAESAFLAVRRGYEVLASFDGLTWTTAESDTDTVSGPCGPGHVAVIGDVIVAASSNADDDVQGSTYCPSWRGTITVVPGPGEPPALVAPGTTFTPDD